MGAINKKQPWPTKDAMAQVYDLNLWGGDKGTFYSGLGSHDPAIVDPYVEVVCSFLSSLDTSPVICDLGCGDFNIGKEFVGYARKYVAVDIVPDLIRRNQEKYDLNGLEFQCLDLAKDELPQGDIAILRQVLQHISNKEVKQVVDKLGQYKYILLTEHIPVGDFTPNIDIISGQGIRIKKGSGVDLLSAPFNLKVKEVSELSRVAYPEGKGEIVTWWYEM